MTRAVVLLAALAVATPAAAGTLTVRGHAFLLDGKPFDLWGVRVASASQTPELTDHLIAQLDEYKAHGVNTVAVFYMGSSAGYGDPFAPDGTGVDPGHQGRVEAIIRACDARGMVVIVGVFYQRCDKPSLRDWGACREAVRTVARLLKPHRNVILNVANEQGSHRYKPLPWARVRNPADIADLCRVAKAEDPGRLAGSGGYDHPLNEAIGKSADVDVLLFDTDDKASTGPLYDRFRAAGVPDKPMVNVETFGAWTNRSLPQGVFPDAVKRKYRDEIDAAAKHPGLYLCLHNTPWFQAFAPGEKSRYDLGGRGTADDPGVRWYFEAVRAAREAGSVPPPDADGGWRTAAPARVGLDAAKLDEAFEACRASTKNGGLLVVRHGWLVYERYFGLAHRDATPNLASVGKSFTSVAVGILMSERPDRFPAGLDQTVFTPELLPPEAFPLSDPAKADIRLGHLLAFTAGIRGNNPCRVHGKEVTIDPRGPDGWQAMVDAVAFGRRAIDHKGSRTTAATLWCKPGEGYSYASASAHLLATVVRHVSGMEQEEYLRRKLAGPLGWGRFTYGYKFAQEITHTPGGGAICVRATDMARFGHLLLREGRWGDRQVVPAGYVRQCGRASPYNPHAPYSLQFDVNTGGQWPEAPRDAFWKGGSGAHMLSVVPSLDLVVWKLGGRDEQYAERDTGAPPDPAAVERAKDRRGWAPTLPERDGQRAVLAKVLAAVTDSPARAK